MFCLIFNPGSGDDERIRFTVSEAQLEDALSYGRAEPDTPFRKQLDATAYHMVLELVVYPDPERLSSQPWVIVRDGEIIGRNYLAAHVSEDDLH